MRHREAITSRPLLLHGVARQTHHAGQTRLTVTSHHGRREAVAAALRRIAGFFRALTRSAEQLTAGDRWRRILAEALKKSLHGREPGRPHGLPPLGPRRRAEIDPEIDRPDRIDRTIVPSNCRI